MTVSILRAVVCGVIVGALAFFMPHLLLGIFVFFFIVRLFHCCGRGHGHGCCGHGYHHGHSKRMFYLADKIHKMNDEEYAEFKEKMGGEECCNSKSECCGSNSKDSGCCETKKEETIK